MKYPDFLSKKDTIGFVAPSFGCGAEPYRSAFDNGLKKLRKLGYGTALGPNCYKGEGIGISSTPENCGRELTEYYISRENQCLISCGGGELMCETMSHVDFEKIKNAPPKWYMGYSDNTNMTFLLTTLCDTASIYGPGAGAFGMEPWHPAVEDALGLLQGKKLSLESYGMWEKESLKDEEHPLAPYHCTEPLKICMFAPDTRGGMEECDSLAMEGRLIGGCMDCLVNLLGTRFDKVTDFLERYRQDGFIWFLEACDLNVFGIRRAMWQMKEAGWFQYIKGFFIGRALNGEKRMGLDGREAVLPVAAQLGVPVFMDVDLGHLPPAMPLITGSCARIEGAENRIRLTMELR